jgi:salicylate hydroxylase
MPSNAESKTETFSPFNIAVIGAGVVGLHVALGLIRRNIRVTVYEQATEHKDIGAGLGFFNSTVACMEEIDPQIATAIKRVAIKGGQVGWTDGLTQEDLTKRPADRLHDVLLPDLGEHWINYFCHRGMVLEELVKCMPEGTIQLSKRVESIVREEDIDGVTVRFTDATVVKVDAGAFFFFFVASAASIAARLDLTVEYQSLAVTASGLASANRC